MTDFLAATAPLKGAHAAIQGLPWDGGVSFRAGAADGPQAIREMSDSIESWSPVWGRDLEDLGLHDAGDADVGAGDQAYAIERIAEGTERLARAVPLVVSLGGDHSVSIGVTRGLQRVYQDLGHVVFDAHLDLRPEYDGSVLSHACGTWHMSDAGPTAVLGVRSGSREEWQDAPKRLIQHGEDLALGEEALRVLAGRPIHLSLDLDILDPGTLGATGTPEPGGPTYKELWLALRNLIFQVRVVAVDLVEVAPALEPSGVSPAIAAKLARDLILGITPA